MEEDYDVVIAGAGPSGSEAARTTASRGYDVAVLESESEGEYPAQSNKSTAGTFPRMMGDFYIPDDVVMKNTDSVVVESPNHSYDSPNRLCTGVRRFQRIHGRTGPTPWNRLYL